MPILPQLQELLEREGVPYEVSTHPPAYTAQKLPRPSTYPGAKWQK